MLLIFVFPELLLMIAAVPPTFPVGSILIGRPNGVSMASGLRVPILPELGKKSVTFEASLPAVALAVVCA